MAAENHQTAQDDHLTETRMSFGEHLEDLRRRIILSLIGLTVGFAVCLYFGSEILSFLAAPLMVALKAADLEPQLHAIRLTEAFVCYIRVAFYGAILLSSPWIFYQLWGFVAAGLYRNERRYVQVFMPFSALLFVLGALFFITIVAPISCSFFARFCTSFQQPDLPDTFISRALEKYRSPDFSDAPLDPNTDSTATIVSTPTAPAPPLIKPTFTLQEYVSLILLLGLSFSLAFQMPLVVFILGRVSLVTIPMLCAYRKYVFLGIVVLAAVMTPPDVVSQVALALPMYLLYELGIILLRIWPAPSR